MLTSEEAATHHLLAGSNSIKRDILLCRHKSFGNKSDFYPVVGVNVDPSHKRFIKATFSAISIEFYARLGEIT